MSSINFFKDKNGKWAVVQFPNPLLITWLLLTLAQMFVGSGHLHSGIHQLGSAVLFAWAYIEITDGNSSFRRLFGGVILLSVLLSFFS